MAQSRACTEACIANDVDMKYKVLLFGPTLSAVSGVSTHVAQLLTSSLAQDFDLVHCRIGSEGRSGGRLGWLLGMARSLLQPIALLWKMVRARPHILHINTSLVPRSLWRDMVYVLLGKLLRLKVVWQVHGGSLAYLTTHHQVGAWCYRHVVRLPDAIVVLSSKELKAHEHIGVRRLSLIPNAIDAEVYRRKKAVRANGPLRIVYLGRLHRDKGLFEAIEGMHMLRARGFDGFIFDIAGAGPDEAELVQRIRLYRLEGHVRLVGVVTGEAKRRFWEDADVLLLPSYHEGLPYTLLEAMAAGTPVVATHVGAIPDVVQSGVHGLLVPPADVPALVEALVLLTSGRPLLEQMSQACVARIAAAYRIERLIVQMNELYMGLVGGQYRPPVPAHSVTLAREGIKVVARR